MIPFYDEEEALSIANDSLYDLAGRTWTSDKKKIFRTADGLTIGTVWVSTCRSMSFLAPFDGREQSGFGRENGLDAIDEFLQSKSVWIHTGEETPDKFSLR